MDGSHVEPCLTRSAQWYFYAHDENKHMRRGLMTYRAREQTLSSDLAHPSTTARELEKGKHFPTAGHGFRVCVTPTADPETPGE